MFPVRPLLAFGIEEQRRRYLPRLASAAGALGAIAFTEPQAVIGLRRDPRRRSPRGRRVHPSGREVLRDQRQSRSGSATRRCSIVEGTSEIQRGVVATYLKHGWRERPRDG
jgi:alkylation response protein AidB-like acyl-CoA dehydrogenase